jgi:hypothetical protein
MAKMRKTASLGGPLPESFDARDYMKKPADPAATAAAGAPPTDDVSDAPVPPEEGARARSARREEVPDGCKRCAPAHSPHCTLACTRRVPLPNLKTGHDQFR